MSQRHDLEKQFARVTERVEQLRQWAARGPAEFRAVLDEAVADLLSTVEELHASDEERVAQNHRLASAGQAVETERRRYLDLFAFAPDGYVVTDAYGLIQESNEAAVSLLGSPATRLVGLPLRAFVATPYTDVIHELLLGLPSGGRSPEREIRVLPAAGEAVPVAVTATVMRDDEGRTTTVRWLLRDVTERRRAAEALARSEAQARAFLETAPIGVVIVDEAGVIVSANAHLETILGYGAGVLEGRRLEELLPERLRSRHAAHRTEYFSAPRSRPMGIDLDLVGRRADGGEVPIDVSLSFVDTPDGRRGIAFVSDVTHRRQAERRQRAEFAVTNALLEAPTIQDAVARVVRAVCGDLGWDVGEFWLPERESGGLRWQGLWHGDRLDPTVLANAGRDLVSRPGFGFVGRTWEHHAPLWLSDITSHAEFVRRDAAVALGFHSALGVLIRNNDRIGVLLFFSREPRRPDDELLRIMEDIGRRVGTYIEHQRAQDELAHQREALVRTEKLAALGTLTAGLAHELNNPLGIISSRIELMLLESQDNTLPARVVEDLGVIHRNIQRVTRLGQALRAFSRQAPHENAPVRLNALVDETALLIRKTFSTENIEVVTTLDEALPLISGDASALQQVLLNLITNAREAMRGGGTIRVETTTLTDAPPRVRVVVADTGEGIPADVLPRIFDPFYTTKATGTGLGLAVSYGIVQDHKGSIEVQSKPGRGTTFVLTFPAMAPEH
jgi:PAS domain S-box-containing protein